MPRRVIAAQPLPGCARELPPPPRCTHSIVRIFPNNVLPCPVVHQQNSRTTHGMNQPPLRPAQFLFDTNGNPLSFLTPSKQRAVTVSIRYKFGITLRSPFRNSCARPAVSSHSPLVTHHSSSHAWSSPVAARRFLNQSLAKHNRKLSQLTENKHPRSKSIASFCRFFDPQPAFAHRISPITSHPTLP